MIEHLSIPGVFVFTPKRFSDERGFFAETFNVSVMEPLTGPLSWVQDNHSLSVPRNVLRGLHFQLPPFAQDKLVRCVQGEIFDVAVDIRHGSPTFGKYVSAVLSAENGAQIFVPKGFAHGFLTIEARTEVAYKVSNYYSAKFDAGIVWDDATLRIDWPLSGESAVLSQKDAALPTLSDMPVYFRYP